MSYRKSKYRLHALCLLSVVTLTACTKKAEPAETRQAPQVVSASHSAATDTLARAVDPSGAGKLRIDASVDFGATAHSTGTSAPKTGACMKQYTTTPDDRLGRLAPGYGIPVEREAPNASVQDADGHSVHLLDFTKSGAILLVFYRGGWCPYCSFEIHELTANYAEYKSRNVTPVAISVDRPEEASKSRAMFKIPFPVLSDPDLTAHQAYHVIHEADDAELTKLKSAGIDIEHASGRKHHSYAVPSLFLIDRTNRVRWAHADLDYKVRPSTQQILAAIDATGLANEMPL
jgi:peroxiredoxin